MSAKGIGAELERLKAAPEWVEDREKAEAGLVGEAAEAEKAEAKNESSYLAAEAGVAGWHKDHRIQSFFVRRGFMQPKALAGLEEKRAAGREAWLDSREQYLNADRALDAHEQESKGMLADHRRRFAPQIEVLESEMLARGAARELDEVAAEMAIEQQVDRAAEGELERPAEREDSHALDEIAADMELEREAERERAAQAEAEAAEARAIEAGAIVKLKAGGAGGPENYSPELRAQIDAARDKKAQGEKNARLAKQARKQEKAERKWDRKWEAEQERAKAPPAKPEPAAPVRQHYHALEISPPGYEPEAEPEQAPEQQAPKPEQEPEPEAPKPATSRRYRQRTQEEIKALTAKRAERNAERMQGKEGEKEVKSKDFQQAKGRGKDDDAFGL